MWFEEEDGLVLADYKTDYTTDPSGEELVQKYKTQLEYYRKALSHDGKAGERSMDLFVLAWKSHFR